MEAGAWIQPQHASYAGMRDAWLRVEELGADTLFNWDYLAPGFNGPDYDLSPLADLISWRDERRKRDAEAAG
ncbi:MAG: hypothetical protein H0V53_02345 [Rubrobacter sp.]|nr:hypothetical protein [Rubrobacter sp.]